MFDLFKKKTKEPSSKLTLEANKPYLYENLTSSNNEGLENKGDILEKMKNINTQKIEDPIKEKIGFDPKIISDNQELKPQPPLNMQEIVEPQATPSQNPETFVEKPPNFQDYEITPQNNSSFEPTINKELQELHDEIRTLRSQMDLILDILRKIEKRLG